MEPDAFRARYALLTPRQRDVLSLRCQGMTNRDVARVVRAGALDQEPHDPHPGPDGAAGLIAGTNHHHGWLQNISVGIIGAVLGGVPFRLLAGQGPDGDGTVGSVTLAVMGAVVLSVILQLGRRT